LKILDKYILKSFLTPFIATFFVVLFVLVMQALWLRFDDLAGKGLNFVVLMKFVWYITLISVPTAIPIGVLLSSIMAIGDLGENYEFAAAKSAGVSLQRLIKPLIILVFFIGAFNFMFLNYVFPNAMFKTKNLILNFKKSKPALALVPGTFNDEIPGYSIKFDEKFGENDDQLKNVLIKDLSAGRGNIKDITAREGKITTEEGSKYMTLILTDGYYYEDHVNYNNPYNDRKNLPFSKAHFDKYVVNIDISSFNNVDFDSESLKEAHEMYSAAQLLVKADSLKLKYDEYVKSRADNFYLRIGGNKLYKSDSAKISNLEPEILDNFELKEKVIVLDNAIQSSNRSIDNLVNGRDTFKNNRKALNMFDIEFFNRISFSFACLVLFFIGAPLGSIIRKGGFGIPMVLGITIFVVYFFISTFGKNMAEESSIPAILGSALSTIILLPVGIFLTLRATKDKGRIDIDLIFDRVVKYFHKFAKQKNLTE